MFRLLNRCFSSIEDGTGRRALVVMLVLMALGGASAFVLETSTKESLLLITVAGSFCGLMVAWLLVAFVAPWIRNQARGESIVFYENFLQEWRSALTKFQTEPHTAATRRRLLQNFKRAKGNKKLVEVAINELRLTLARDQNLDSRDSGRLLQEIDRLEKMAEALPPENIRIATSR